MRIATDELESLQSRLVAPVGQSTQVEEAPILVASLVAGLVNPSNIRAAVTTYSGGPPSVWTVHAITASVLAYVEVDFDEQLYTGEVERDVPKYRGRYPSADVRAAWVRPLSRISEMTITRSAPFSDTGQWSVAALVRFGGEDQPVSLPDQCSIYSDEQWARTGDLLRVIRDAIGSPQ
ncbi:hypothetical protein QRB36_06350 [Mycobacterium marseillense]|uniref:hypothetical protein n=1 Tax=Mycobacterium marseillense TaxID=701042 RepID=UPI0025926D26|nr:hypothetical protein [Mycobacterium marseillense]MDM3973783.1 hypothetical protein [Mycobacterium marseillense]